MACDACAIGVGWYIDGGFSFERIGAGQRRRADPAHRHFPATRDIACRAGTRRAAHQRRIGCNQRALQIGRRERELALGAVHAANSGKRGRIVRRSIERLSGERFRVTEVLGPGRRGNRREHQTQIVGTARQGHAVTGERIAVVACRRVETPKRGLQVGIVGHRGEPRRDHVVGARQVAALAHGVALPHHDGQIQIAEIGALLRRQLCRRELPHHRAQFGILMSGEQNAGVLQQQIRIAWRGVHCVAYEPERTARVTRLLIGRGHHADQFRAAGCNRLRGRERGESLLGLPALRHLDGEARLLMHPQAVLQGGHRVGTLGDRNAIQLLEPRRPVLGFRRQQRACIKRVGHIRVGRQQPVHHAARVADGTLTHVDAREIEAQPRIIRIAEQRIFEQAACRTQIAARFRSACLGSLRFAT